MGKEILIYDNGQVYEVDSDLIYVPTFEKKDDKNEETEVRHYSDLHSG